MQFKQNASVFTSSGKKVGEIHRVVIDPRHYKVTDIVVREGFIFPKSKVIPVEFVASTSEDRVSLEKDEDELKGLPDFEENFFIPANPDDLEPDELNPSMAAPVYWYPISGTPHGDLYTPSDLPITSTAREEVENIPQGTVPLKEGAEVFSSDGKHVGNVEQVITDSESHRLTQILISKGVFLKERKLVPRQWVDHIHEGQVFLAVKASLLSNLPGYQQS